MKRLLAAAIPLVLLLSVTGSVIAENTPQRLTNNLNLPPEAIDFDLSDLIDADQKQRDQKLRGEWSAYQNKMATAYAETQAFVDSGTDRPFNDTILNQKHRIRIGANRVRPQREFAG